MSQILLFVLFAASQIGTPGPANMALLATGARYGLKRAFPFVAGVAIGKQFVIWPLGFGLARLAVASPGVFFAMKWAAAAYICWLAWKVAGLRLTPGNTLDRPPGFLAGLIVHPLNPKAWAMIIASFTSFTDPDASAFSNTLLVAAVLFGCQAVLHPIWTYAGERIARSVVGTPLETYLMRGLAITTVASVAFALFAGD